MGIAAGALSMVASIGSTIVGIMGAKQQADAAAATATYNAQVARNAAVYEQQMGVIQAQQEQRKTAALIGRQRAMYGAMGVDVNSGSPLDIQADTYTFGKLNEAQALNNAQRRAWGLSTQATLYDYEAYNDKQAGKLNMLGAAIGGIGSISNRWSQFQQSGVFSSDPFNPGGGSMGVY